MMTLLLFVIGATVYFAIGIAIAGILLSVASKQMDNESVVDFTLAEAVLVWPVLACIALGHSLLKLLLWVERFAASVVRYIFRLLA